MRKATPWVIVIIVIIIVLAIFYWIGAFTFQAVPAGKYHNGEEVSMSGKIVCLPHRDQTGPQTMECALGLQKSGTGTYFGLSSTHGISETGGVRVGDTVDVAGSIKNAHPEGKYAITAEIEVGTIKILEDGNSGNDEGSKTVVPTDWKTYSQESPSFSLSYPKEWNVEKGASAGQRSGFWSTLGQATGTTYVTIATPKDFLPGSNVPNAQVSVGSSNDKDAVKSCEKIPEGHTPGTSAGEVNIGGMQFVKIAMTQGAAGNRYETGSYRTVRDGKCYAVEYLIHYIPTAMFESGRVADRVGQVRQTVENIVKSFAFSAQSGS